MADREEKPCAGDAEIDYMNQKRNIPFELSAEETLLYTYSQKITRATLENMYAKYMEATKQGDLTEATESNVTLSQGQEFDEGLPLLVPP